MLRRWSFAAILCFLWLALSERAFFVPLRQLPSSRGRTAKLLSGHVEVQNLSHGCSELLVAMGVVLLAVPFARQSRSSRAEGKAITRRAEGTAVASSTEEDTTVHSPFEGTAGKEEKEEVDGKLPLTRDNVEKVLDEVRPFLIQDGGNVKIVEIDGPVVKLELQGACSSCSASDTTMKMGIEQKLVEKIPEISQVISVTPEQEVLTKDGVEEVLDGIRPFLSVSGGSIEMDELVEGEDSKVVLKMIGPPLKSMAVRVEVQNRIKRKYPLLSEVSIVGEDGKPPVLSA